MQIIFKKLPISRIWGEGGLNSRARGHRSGLIASVWVSRFVVNLHYANSVASFLRSPESVISGFTADDQQFRAEKPDRQ